MNGTWQVDDLPARVRCYAIQVDPASGCYRVCAPHDKDGYAKVGKTFAHRITYTECIGPIPAGRQIDHVKARGCIWRDCSNPGHLEAVTARVNTLRGCSFAAVNAAKTHCDSGHEFDLFNTYVSPDGHRHCRPCNREAVARYQARKRGAVVSIIPAELRTAA